MTTAAKIVAALRLPVISPSKLDIEPLSLGVLTRLRQDSSLEYAIASIDGSGRIADIGIVNSMGWKVGDGLELALQNGGVLIQRSTNSTTALAEKRRLAVPVGIRRSCGIRTGDRVLLVAAPEFGFVLIHTMATLDAMVVNHHASMVAGGDI